MGKTTFWDVIQRTIEAAGTPLSAVEIWEKANELGTLGNFKTNGKTPWQTIGAYCYHDINNNGESSMIIQTSFRPAQFFLRKLGREVNVRAVQKAKDLAIEKKEKASLKKKYNERDLHTLLASYAYGESHFKANLKTIFHESSSRTKKGKNEWLHPDMVGVYFPFRDFKNETLEIQNHLSISSIKLFSFELKIALNFGNLRQCFFQAVSNSSWANEGYLVVLNMDEEPTLKEEIRRLNNAFGIGIIKLNANNIFESEILFPARHNQDIDWDTVDRLALENSDFSAFLRNITEDCKLGKVKSQYDQVLKPEELDKFLKEKGISDIAL